MPSLERAKRRASRARSEPRRNVKIKPAAMRHRREADRRFIRKMVAASKATD